jgi:hypothetical protein
MISSEPTAAAPSSNPFHALEERWFADQGRSPTTRPTRTSSTTPPPPIGDPLADRWFR